MPPAARQHAASSKTSSCAKDEITAWRAHLRRVELLDYFASAEREWSALLVNT
jgi:hypothetical protein